MPIDPLFLKMMHSKDVQDRAKPEPTQEEKNIAEAIRESTPEPSQSVASSESHPVLAHVPANAVVANQEPAPEKPETPLSDSIPSATPLTHKAVDFKKLLDDLDAIVSSELGIQKLTIDTTRQHVKQIMLDLVTQPELDAFIIDRDVHNILSFIRFVKDDAVVVKVEQKERKAKTTEKQKKINAKFGDFKLDMPLITLNPSQKG